MEPLEDDWLTKLRKLVFAELHKVVRKGARLKDENSPEVVHLTYVLGIIHWKKQADPRLDPNEQLAGLLRRGGSVSSILSVGALEQGDPFAWEYWVQHGVWPESRQGYAMLPSQARWPMLDVADKQEKEREFEELREKKRRADEGLRIEHQREARQIEEQIAPLEREVARLGQPDLEIDKRTKYDDRRRALQAAQPILNKRKVKGWHDFAVELRAIFHAELPQQFDETAYHFIAGVMPHITNERPIPGTVKKYLLRGSE